MVFSRPYVKGIAVAARLFRDGENRIAATLVNDYNIITYDLETKRYQRLLRGWPAHHPEVPPLPKSRQKMTYKDGLAWMNQWYPVKEMFYSRGSYIVQYQVGKDHFVSILEADGNFLQKKREVGPPILDVKDGVGDQVWKEEGENGDYRFTIRALTLVE